MNTKKTKGFLLFVIIHIFGFVVAQNTSTGTWMQYFGNKKINEKWNWWHEVQSLDISLSVNFFWEK